MKRIRSTATYQIYEYIRTHPGCTRKEILTMFPPNTNSRTVGTLLFNLQAHHAIVNKGGATSAARWYPVEFSAKPEYLAMADNLLEELTNVHRTVQKSYLAMRLEEIVES